MSRIGAVTIQPTFDNWATLAANGLDWTAPPYTKCAPNLVALLDWLRQRWGGYSLGCHMDRTVRQGSAISAHAFGSALDWRYELAAGAPAGAVNVPRAVFLAEIVPEVIRFSAELHVDAIHDYRGDRIWRAGRTTNVADATGSWWKVQNGAGAGMGEAWATYAHFETTRDGWGDTRAITNRIGAPPPPPRCTVSRLLILGATGDDVKCLQLALRDHPQHPQPTVAVDGQFGPQTERAVRNYQNVVGLVVDGRAGRLTLTSLGIWGG